MRGYTLDISDGNADEPDGDFVIANNIKEAKKMFINNCSDWLFEYDDWFTRMRVKWNKKANIEGLKHGTFFEDIDPVEAIKRNISGVIFYTKCPECQQEDKTIQNHEQIDRICCDDCFEKIAN